MVAVEPMGQANPPRMSDEEWANLPEDEPGELVDGVLVEEEVGNWLHEAAVSWLVRMLGNWGEPLGGLVGCSELRYLVKPGRGRKPDISVILPGRKSPPRLGPLRKPADILIEVVSPSPRDARRDRIEKRREYAEFGVRYYWILDPTLKTLEIYELNAEGKYVVALEADTGIIENVPGCPGLVLDLDALWARLDSLSDDEEGAETKALEDSSDE